LAPGAEANYWWGPWDWSEKAIVVSASPVTKTGGEWAVTVTRVSQEVKADGSGYLYARVKNLGSGPVDFTFCLSAVYGW
jgi:hypothetical protein